MNAHTKPDRSDVSFEPRRLFDNPESFYGDAAECIRNVLVLTWTFDQARQGRRDRAAVEIAETFMSMIARDMGDFVNAVQSAECRVNELRRLHEGYVAATREGLRVQGWPAQRIDAFCADAEQNAAVYDPVPPGARVGGGGA